MDETIEQNDADGSSDEHIINVAIKNTTPAPTTEPEPVLAIEPEPDAAADTDVPTASLDPAALEAMTIEAEIEPATVSTNPQPAVPAEPAVDAATDEAAPPTHSADAPQEPPVQATPLAIPTNKRKQRRIIMAAAGVILVAAIAVLTWWLLSKDTPTTASAENKNTVTKPVKQAKVGLAVTIIDGTAEHLQDSSGWLPLSTSSQLKEGDSVRTAAESRAVLTLDDGSAIRLDSSTSIVVTSLAANDIKIQQVTGALYSRVVPSERAYTVSVEGVTYKAMGTAFVTTNTMGESGVQVYQSSVKASDAPEIVTEGHQYYKINSRAELTSAVTAINIDSLVDNTFVNWNLGEDEKSAIFKEKLGILSQVKLRTEEKTKKAEAEEAAKLQAEKEAAEKARQAAEDAKKQTTGDRVVRGTMTLQTTQSGGFSWSHTGKAVYGYKLLYSKKPADPLFGASGVESIYFSSISDTSGTLPKRSELSSGTYKVRVCAYTNGTETDTCVDYSNIVSIVIN